MQKNQQITVAIMCLVCFIASNSIRASQQLSVKLPRTWDLVRQQMTKKAEPNKPVQPERDISSAKPTEVIKSAEPAKMQQVEPQTKERVLHFPKYRSIGQLAIGDVKVSVKQASPRNLFEEVEWESFGDAKGDIKIPKNKVVRLTLASWTWQNPVNLSALKQLKPDDIYSLYLSPHWSAGNINPNDKCMPYITYMTGLNTLNLYGANISAKGLDLLTKLKALERLYCPDSLNDSGMTAISKLTSLKSLYIIGNNTVTNKGLTQLSNLKFLDNLGLNAVNMTDEGLKNLGGLAFLRYLSLVGNFTNDAFIYLNNAKSLKSIQIEISKFDDGGMKNLSNLTQLENFNAHRMSGITDSGVAYLKNMTNLKNLDFWAAKLTDSSMQVLGKIHTLEYLNLPTSFTDEGIKFITDLKNLKFFWIGRSTISPLTDESLRYIGQLKNLEELNIGGAGFSDEGMQSIAKLIKLKRLWLLKADMLTNKGLDELAKLESLTDLYLGSDTKITISGIKALNSLKTLKSLNLGDVHQDNSTAMDISGLTELETLKITLHCIHRMDMTTVYDSFREQDLAFLSNLKNLTSVQITGRGITDSAIKNLSELENLELIIISTGGETLLTDASLKDVTKLKKLSSIFIMTGHITDKSLEYLAELPSLRRIELTSDVAFSAKAVRNLKAKNPNIEQLQLKP
jgi:hypothetical protein